MVNVTHLGRGATAAQRVALLWSHPKCATCACSSTFVEIDHRDPWAYAHRTPAATRSTTSARTTTGSRPTRAGCWSMGPGVEHSSGPTIPVTSEIARRPDSERLTGGIVADGDRRAASRTDVGAHLGPASGLVGCDPRGFGREDRGGRRDDRRREGCDRPARLGTGRYRAFPSLCDDSRLAPYGECRMCLVRVDGQPQPVASSRPGPSRHGDRDRSRRYRVGARRGPAHARTPLSAGPRSSAPPTSPFIACCAVTTSTPPATTSRSCGTIRIRASRST